MHLRSINVAPPDVIWVIDDDAVTRRAVVRYLEVMYPEYRVQEAHDGSVALAGIDVDTALIITDANMPVVDGAAFCRSLRERTGRLAGIPVIMLTGNDSLEFYEESLMAGVTMFVPKGSDLKILKRAVDNLIGE